jgi:hypothetical protein
MSRATENEILGTLVVLGFLLVVAIPIWWEYVK